MGDKLNPPSVASIIPAQTQSDYIVVPFEMNRSVGWSDFESVELIVKSVQSNKQLNTSSCGKDSIVVRGQLYYASFPIDYTFQVGQYYKIQIAYKRTGGSIGFYSSAATFKFTSHPTLTIQGLDAEKENNHIFNYTGKYVNSSDSSEKVYSYWFNLYDTQNKLIASSGEKLHNSSTDKSTTESVDSWETRQALQSGSEYFLTYHVKTINGLECSSPTYRIIDKQTVPSSLSQYYKFVATNNPDSACIELNLQAKKNNDRKLMNGKFVITRSSSEDNFQSWHELTRFMLSGQSVLEDRFICKDYSVSQGVTYIYGLQAYNNRELYTIRQETDPISVDFEDMFLSDGDRQLRIRFNPKVTSFKKTLLEAKMDTLGGKYPFFFRNGNVEYKEFPISGMISLLMDENEEFLYGIQNKEPHRKSTPAEQDDYKNLKTSLTGDNFCKERNFKMEVLDWLTNGKPKLFRSPGEGSFIVRLMNTSLTPNDTLSRMLHTFSSTAYEMDDFTFENLRKYKILVDEYIETRDLRMYSKNLYETNNGRLTNLNAYVATIHAQPGTEFYYKLNNDETPQTLIIGSTGTYIFSPDVLQEHQLMEVGHRRGVSGWFPEATLIYGTYSHVEIDNFSYIDSIHVSDSISQWVGTKSSLIESNFKYPLKQNIGLIYYLNLAKRDIIIVDAIESVGVKSHRFKIDGVYYTPAKTELISYNGRIFDGQTTFEILTDIDYNVQLRKDEDPIDFQGTGSLVSKFLNLDDKYEVVTGTGGRIVLSNLSDIDYLYLGNGVYADIAYQVVTKTYTAELEHNFSKPWDKLRTEAEKNNYYNTLETLLENTQQEDVVDAI